MQVLAIETDFERGSFKEITVQVASLHGYLYMRCIISCLSAVAKVILQTAHAGTCLAVKLAKN